ncbi:hypothetical protein TCAL_11303 [Tigriopus californicus]|uniref:Uncharacterized protein n=1 Tax=Tigriopus californicus TaxID=6832 RepID=A0A553N9M3_TIGCA|nr:uncharacterized protein LOC131884739 [Tigriopus californicus]TRY62144.1 hypothetical protein TCAL_11303 [Tigriopus californicus]|eukprot:TCALIF_11303-PA protein Name:"Protein of unknown function" AED:0.00 eAED:0.00 QI:144/1/1/1/0.66/0.75/4/6/341
MGALEHNVFFAFLMQAMIIAAIFAIAICWLSCVRKYFNIPCLLEDEAQESESKKNFPPDLPPNYNDADRFSQLEMSPADVLYPPPAYSELSLPALFEGGLTLDSSTRRHSAPGQPGGRFEDAESLNTTRDEYVHRNSIAVISDHNEPCGLVQAPESLSPTSNSSSLPTKWLRPLLSRVRQERKTSLPRKQTDHVYVPAGFDRSRSGDGFVSVDLQHPLAFQNSALQVSSPESIEDVRGSNRRASVALASTDRSPPSVRKNQVRATRSVGSLRSGTSADAGAGEDPIGVSWLVDGHPAPLNTVVVTIHGQDESPEANGFGGVSLPPIVVTDSDPYHHIESSS